MKQNKPFRIGIDCRMYSKKFTGIGRYINQLVFNVAKVDQKNHYILFLNQEDDNALKLPGPNFTKVLVNSPHYSVKEQTKFLLALYKEKLDLVHFTNFNQPIFYIKPQITTIHDTTLHFYPGRKYKSPIYRWAYKFTMFSSILKSKAIIAISQNTKKDINNFYPHSKNKTHVIYNGIDKSFQNKSSKSQKTKDEYILYTGNWREHKNLPNLIKAFKILKHKHNYKGELILTGNPNPLYPEPLQLIKEFKLENSIKQVGLVNQEELNSLYQDATAYIFPSFYEGFGLPILESFASNTPVVCSDTACLPEIAQDAALYFDPHSPESIANTINALITDTKLQKELIRKGQERLKNFSFLEMAKQTHNLYIQSLK